MLVAGWQDLDGARRRVLFLLARLLPSGAARTRRSAACMASPRRLRRRRRCARAARWRWRRRADPARRAGPSSAAASTSPRWRASTPTRRRRPSSSRPAITNPSGQTGGSQRRPGRRRGPDHGSRLLGQRLRAGLPPARQRRARPGLRHGGVAVGPSTRTARRASALDGDRAVVAGAAGPGPRTFLGSLDGAEPDACRLGSTPRAGGPSHRHPQRALDVALGPGGTVYTAGIVGTPNRPFVARHLANAAPVAALASAAARGPARR